MFRDVPGCSGMFRDVPECSGIFHVPGCSMFRLLSTPLEKALPKNSEFTQQDGKQNRTAKRLVWQTWHGYYLRVLSWYSLILTVSVLLEKDLFTEESEVCRKISNKIIVTLVTQGLPSSFLSRPVASAHHTVLTGTQPTIKAIHWT